METIFKDYIITDEKEKMQLDVIAELLKGVYWAKSWSLDIIKKALDNSICFGVFYREKQIAYARCVTDDATMYWLCDVVVEKEYRNKGIGSALVDYIVSHEKLNKLMGILSSNHSKELYKKYGFKLSSNGFMIKTASKMQEI